MECVDFKHWLVLRDGAGCESADKALYHLKGCPDCMKLYDADTALSEVMMEGFKEEELPCGLMERIEEDLDAVKGDRVGKGPTPWRVFAKAVAPVLAVAAMLVVFIYPQTGKLESVDEIVKLAVENHLSDLTIKFTTREVSNVPGWFGDKLDFAVAVPDLAGSSLALIGGRKCSLGRNDVAYLFYKYPAQDKRTSVFVIDGNDIGFEMVDGKRYRTAFNDEQVTVWKSGALAYVMVE